MKKKIPRVSDAAPLVNDIRQECYRAMGYVRKAEEAQDKRSLLHYASRMIVCFSMIAAKVDEMEGLMKKISQSMSPSKPTTKIGVLRPQVFERDGHKCTHCGRTDKLVADHIFPASRGGETTLENLQTLCFSCNTKKRNRTMEELGWSRT
jgi:hypothetical protein